MESSNDNNISTNFSTIPSYEQIKQKIVTQLAIAENNFSNYLSKQTDIKFKYARTALYKLSYAISDYFYLIEDSKEKQYICFFLSNPDYWEVLTDLAAILTLCKTVIYKLGITQIESAKLPQYESYKELE